METIHRLMLALGEMSGLASIPLIYLASTSTTRFRTPMRYRRRERSKGTIEAVDFELGLGVLRFSIIERNGAEATVIPLARIFNIALAQMESNCKVRRVNCENNWSRRSIVDGTKCGRRE